MVMVMVMMMVMVMVMVTLLSRDDSPFKLERASPPPTSDLSHPLSRSWQTLLERIENCQKKYQQSEPNPKLNMSSSHPLLSTSSASHSGTYNPIWSPASISPSANELMSGPGSGAKKWKSKLFPKKIWTGYLPSEKSGGYTGSGVYGANYGWEFIIITVTTIVTIIIIHIIIVKLIM